MQSRTFAWLVVALTSVAAIVIHSPTSEAQSLVQADSNVYWPSISSNGQVIALFSRSSSWIGTYASYDMVFLVSHARRRVINTSRNGGYAANGSCMHPQISADGRWLVHQSSANNLIGGYPTFTDTNGFTDIFVCEVEEDVFSQPAPGFSHRLVSIGSDGRQANGNCLYPRISADGRFVVFQSSASNLADGDTCSGPNIFVHDRDFNTNGIYDEVGMPGGVKTVRVSVKTDGSNFPDGTSLSRPVISDNGRYVAFTVDSEVWTRDRDSDGDGVYDQPGGVRTFRSCPTWGGGGADMSPCGRFIGSKQVVSAKQKVAMFDSLSSSNKVVSDPVDAVPSGYANHPVIGEGGVNVAFMSASTNLVPGDANGRSDVFLRLGHSAAPMETMGMELISVSSSGIPGNGDSGGWIDAMAADFSVAIDMTPDARYVVFQSFANNLVADDTNGVIDVFVRDRQEGVTERIEHDRQNPSWPPGSTLTSTATGMNSASLVWTAAADNVGVGSYKLLWNGGSMLLGPDATRALVAGLEPGTPYNFTLVARDLAANATSNSPEVAVTTMPAPTDADGDGIADVWEISFFGNIANCNPIEDSDNDGIDNLGEYLADTNPNNATSLPRIVEGTYAEGFLRLPSSTSRLYRLQTATNLLPGVEWKDAGDHVIGSGSNLTFETSLDANAGFHRISISPQ